MVQHLAHTWEAPRLFAIGEAVSDAYVIRSAISIDRDREVYAADDLVLGRRVAIKTMACGAHLRREAQALAELHHPALVTVHGFGVHRATPYLVMEHLFGLSLAELATRGLAWRDAVEILIRVADGLAVVHDAGIAHRDLRAERVMICGGGRAVLVDLGAMAASDEGGVRDDVRAFGVLAEGVLPRAGVPSRLASVIRSCATAPSMDHVAWELRASIGSRRMHH